jgi:hypothetical protein
MFTGPKGAALRRNNFHRSVRWPECVAEQYGLLPAVPLELLDDRTNQNLDDSAYKSLSGPSPTISVGA